MTKTKEIQKDETYELESGSGYDMTSKGYKQVFVFIIQGKFREAMKLLKFAKKSLSDERRLSHSLGFDGDDQLKEKKDEINNVLFDLKENKSIEEILHVYSENLGLPFDLISIKHHNENIEDSEKCAEHRERKKCHAEELEFLEELKQKC